MFFFCLCSYDDDLLGATRKHQQQNPEVIVSSRPSVVIVQFRKILEATARDIRYLLSEEICVPDDEDDKCIQPDDYCNIPIIPEVEVDYSGSGEPPTINFGKIDDNTTSSNTSNTTVPPTTSSPTNSQTVTHETSTPSKPKTDATFPPEWTKPTDPNPIIEDEAIRGGASLIHQSLYMILLLTATALLLC